MIRRPVFGIFGVLLLFLLPALAHAAFSSPSAIPNWDIAYHMGGISVTASSTIPFASSTTYAFPGTPRGVFGEIYRGELHNAELVASHDVSGGSIESPVSETEPLLTPGNYFVAIYEDYDRGYYEDQCLLFDACSPPPAHENAQEWFTLPSDDYYAPPYWNIVGFTIVATSTPPAPACAKDCNSSVLFLPGIEASRLYRPDYNGGTDQLWEPNTESDVTDLFLDGEGKSVRNDVYTKDVIDEKNVLPIGQGNVYKSFLADLAAWKNIDHLIADYSAVPYDWRLSLDDVLNSGNNIDGRIYYSGDNAATSSPFILQELRRLAASSRTGKVTIIAHSNGGLLTKAIIKKLGDIEAAKLIDKVIFVAVPQIGTPMAIGALLHGYDQGLPLDALPLILTPQTARAFASTSPSAYHLLPSAAYFTSEGSDVRSPMITFGSGVRTQSFIDAYGHAIGNPTELHNFLIGSEGRVQPLSSDVTNPSILSPALLAYGERVHQAPDGNWTFPSSIMLYQIAGWGEETVGGIRYSTGKECQQIDGRCASFLPKLIYTPEMVVDGDGTVVTPSALAMSTSTGNVMRWWVDLGKYNTQPENYLALGFIDRKHANILEVPELRNFIKDNLLTNLTTSPPLYLSTSTPSTKSDARLRYFLHSPLALSAHDSAGNEISMATSTIPGATYRRFGEVQYISLPASTHPTLVLTGVAQGSFTLQIEEVIGNTITASTTFAGIPSATSTIVTMDFMDGTIANSSPLRVDEDGNGTTDFSLTPKVGESATLSDTLAEPVAQSQKQTNTLIITVSGGMGTPPETTKIETAPPAVATNVPISSDENSGSVQLVNHASLTFKEEEASRKTALKKAHDSIAEVKITPTVVARSFAMGQAASLPATLPKVALVSSPPLGLAAKNLASVGNAFQKDSQQPAPQRTLGETLSDYWRRVASKLKENLIRWRSGVW